jgi:hypothetical protein
VYPKGATDEVDDGELEEKRKKTKEVGPFNSLLLILTPQAPLTN